ncbi:Dual-specificity kinase, spindle pole body (SPB) duplication and spindle checkpoint function [Onygenales sp. PD_10]|nr:Dual-specificity kinase, spindle pole body (SPB) duplication and spindle checkpoint function [Onygenales sp. PD_10]
MASSVDAKLLKQTKFPPEFNKKVDMNKVNVEVMKKWIAGKISEILGNEDDVVIELCFNLLEGSRFPDIKVLQIQLTGFLDKDTAKFCKELWNLCLSAQDNPQGVPKELLEAKKLELRQEKLESERQAEEARRRKEEERIREREMETLRQRERADRGRGGRGGHRDFDRRGDRDSRSPPRRWRSPDRFRDGPSRRRADTWAPSGGRPSRWADDRGRRTSRQVSPSISRSPSRSSISPSPPRRGRGGRHRPARRRRSISSSRSPERGDRKRRRRNSPDRGDHRARSSSSTRSSRSPSPRRRRGRSLTPSSSRSISRSPPPRNIRHRRAHSSVSRSRSSSRRRSSRSRSNDRGRGGRGGRRRRSPSYDAKDDKNESRADVSKDRPSRDDRRRLSRSRSRERPNYRRRRSPSRSRSRSRSPFRSRSRSRSRSHRDRNDRKRHQSIERYAHAGRRRQSSSTSPSAEKRQTIADSEKETKHSLSPAPRKTPEPEEPKEKATNPDEKPTQPKSRLSGTELRERLAREKVKALRRESAQGKAPPQQEFPPTWTFLLLSALKFRPTLRYSTTAIISYDFGSGIDASRYASGVINMATTASPTPIPLTYSNSFQRPGSRQLSRTTTSRTLSNRASPNTGASGLNSGIFPMSRPQTYSMGDSSDDDFPEPIKFSASVKALLGEEDGSNAELSPSRARSAAHINKNSILSERPQQTRKPQERQVRIASPRERATGSPSPRVVRVSSARLSPSALSRESSILGKQDEKVLDTSEQPRRDLITPAAPRTRVVRVVRSGSRSPSTISPSGTRSSGRSSREGGSGSRLGDRSFSGDDRQREERGVRSGSSTVLRSRPGEDTGMQSSLRIKRVGKLTGSFLNGPARRGVIRRQSEEIQEDESEWPSAGASPRMNEERQQENGQSDDQSFEKPKQYPRPSEQSSGSPVPIQAAKRYPDPEIPRQEPLLGVTPPEHPISATKPKSPLSTELRTSSKSTKEAPIFYQVPPFNSKPANRSQENDPPPTFRRSKSHGFGLDKAEKFSVIYDDEKEPAKQAPTTVSPRKPLAPRDNNTPRRPAPPPPKMSVLETATAPAGATSSQARRKRVQVTINRKPFTRLDCIGRGGSSRVYRVMAENCKIFALKRVNLEDVDPLAMAGYKGEIDLLKKLENVDRVVRLFDWEINEEKHALSVLMEIGESDLYRVLTLRLNSEDAVFDPTFTRYYWKEMLECVQAVHEFDIVHSDLKPANFVLVKGNLKLIDFGIANAIQDDTVNVHREQQIGTPNYMAPESLIDINAATGLPSSAGKMMKVGKPSDVWSLGCILYQMVYGKPPFAHITKPLERIMAIPNPSVVIDYPAFGVGGVSVPPGLIKTLKRCLQRDQRLRPTVKELLSQRDPFLYPEASLEGTVPMTQEMLGRILTNVVNHCRARGPPKDEDLAGWPAGFFAKIKSALEEDAL